MLTIFQLTLCEKQDLPITFLGKYTLVSKQFLKADKIA